MLRGVQPIQVPSYLLYPSAPQGAPSSSYLHFPPSLPGWARLSHGESEEQAGQVQGGRGRADRCGIEPQVGCRVHLLASLSVESSYWALAPGIYLDLPLSLCTSLGDVFTLVVPAVRNRPA